MKTLVHICCGPCATASVPFWREQGHELVGFYFNPNIQPFLEFRRRLTGVRDFAEEVDLSLEEDLYYDPAAWLRIAGDAAPARCRNCLAWRLERAAAAARVLGCDAFTTTLAISPYQDHEAIKSGGRSAAERHHVEFLYEDLRPLFAESRSLARSLGLYRQKYCGCILSEWERYRDAKGSS